MLILTPYRNKVFIPVAQKDWRAPSLHVKRDQFGNPVRQTRFYIRGFRRLDDGFRLTTFTLWFDSRDDWDHFSHATVLYRAEGIPIPREDWQLPVEVWGDPTLYPDLGILYAAPTFLSGTSASNQTDSVPADWNNSANLIEVVAPGGSGGARRGANAGGGNQDASGAGGGGYSAQTNVSLTPGGSATYRLPAGATGVSAAVSDTSTQGNDAADAWYNGTTLAGATVGAKGGLKGSAASGTVSGGLGGAAASGIGSTKTSGGRGGDVGTPTNARATGGGGAGGPSSDGSNGVDTTGTGADAGGNGGGPNGGAGSAGTLVSGGTSSNGGTGTTWDATHGTGGGSGGGATSSVGNSSTSGAGGAYGAGSGGAATRNPTTQTGDATSGNGGQALIIKTYTPISVFNTGIPMLGW